MFQKSCRPANSSTVMTYLSLLVCGARQALLALKSVPRHPPIAQRAVMMPRFRTHSAGGSVRLMWYSFSPSNICCNESIETDF